MRFTFHRSSCRNKLLCALCLRFAVFCSTPTTCTAADFSLKSREEVEKKVGESIRTFLGGRALQVGCLVRSPSVFWKGVGKSRRLGGISVEQMRELASRYGFSVEFFEVASNGGYDSIVARVGGQDIDANLLGDALAASGDRRLIDISVQMFTATGIRSLTARQTASPVDTVIVFVRRKLPFLRDMESVFIAFAWELWTLLFAVLFFIAANLAFIDCMRTIWPKRRQVDPDTGQMTLLSAVRTIWKMLANDKRRIGRMYWDQVFNLGSLLFGQLPIRPSDDAPSRILYILFKAFAFGLAAFYTALLVNQFQSKTDTTQLSMEKFCNEQQVEGRSLEDIVVEKGTSYQAYILNYLRENAALCPNIGEGVRNRFDGSVPGGGENLCEDSESCLKLVADGNAYATLIDGAEAHWMLSHGKCNSFEIIGETGSSSATTWILPLDESYTTLAESISNAILLARDDGSFDRITQAAINRDGCRADDLNRVAIRNVIGFLIPMVVMFIIAWSVQLFKYIRSLFPFISRWTNADGPVWGTNAGECLCQSPTFAHASHATASDDRGFLRAAFGADGNPIRKKMEGAVLVRPLHNSPWESYIQSGNSSGDSDCPSAP